MVVVIKILQVILALSVLVLIHELGHFTFAKIFKVRVEKFYLFFDIGGKALFKFKPKNSDTEYGIGWLPLGGYCRVSGMIDESLDKDSLKSEPKNWEMRSKPAWQRFFIMFGGVLFNFLFAIALYIGILATWGEGYISNKGKSVYVNELAHEMGFRTGDQILMFDEQQPEDFSMLQVDLARNEVQKAVVLRDEDTVTLYMDHNMLKDVLKTPGMFSLAIPFTVDRVDSSSINAKAGLLKGDKIIGIEGNNLRFIQESREILSSYKNSTVSTKLVRGSDTITTDLKVDSLGLFGVYVEMPAIETKEYSFIEAIPAGFSRTFETIGGYIKDLKLVFTPSTQAYKSVGSFISIGQVFPSSWNWNAFLNILALLSIMLGVMNLIPIPALDGGHIVFIIYEMITKKKPSEKFLFVMQSIGMIFLLLLMVLAFSNDISRLIH